MTSSFGVDFFLNCSTFYCEQEEEVAGAVSESDSEEELKEEVKEWTAVRPRNKCNPESVPDLVTSENKSNSQPPHRPSEEVRSSLMPSK